MGDWIYPIRFVDEIQDWSFILHTTEEKDDEEIIQIINYWSDINSSTYDDYSPVSIMDDVVEHNPGWSWEDGVDEIEIRHW